MGMTAMALPKCRIGPRLVAVGAGGLSSSCSYLPPTVCSRTAAPFLLALSFVFHIPSLPQLKPAPVQHSCTTANRRGIMADEVQNDVNDQVADIAPFDPTKKKKKKKVVLQDLADESVDKLAEKTESLSVSDGLETTTFSGLKKKKKKPVEAISLTDDGADATEDLEDQAGENEDQDGITLQYRYPWEGSDRDYEYEELLGRVFNILRENNPELAGDRRRTVMRPPQVLREGTKKTVFVNFMDLCKTMHRQPDHVMAFLLAELGTSGSLDGQQRLVVKGRFAPKNFEGILRRYVNEYVICIGCKSPDTILSKENRLFFLRCEKCGSGRSVAPIKAGFVARTVSTTSTLFCSSSSSPKLEYAIQPLNLRSAFLFIAFQLVLSSSGGAAIGYISV
ncbi:hypothetical protein SDJN03_19243, partial [Cucurbita argyrosperma subsp. sororia]